MGQNLVSREPNSGYGEVAPAGADGEGALPVWGMPGVDNMGTVTNYCVHV